MIKPASLGYLLGRSRSLSSRSDATSIKHQASDPPV